MFKKIASNALGSAFIALSLAAFIVIFAACDSGGGNKNEESSSSVVPSSGSTRPIEPPPGVIEVLDIDAIVGGLKDHELTGQIIVRVGSSGTEAWVYLINKVEIKAGSIKIKEDTASGNKKSYDTEFSYEFKEQELCNGAPFSVCASVFLDSAGIPKTYGKCKDNLSRSVSKCNPSSSSVSSSSVAAAPKSFVPLLASPLTLNSTQQFGSRGIVLSSGEGTTNLAQADIYFETVGSTYYLKTDKNSVKIVSNFRTAGSPSGPILWDYDNIGYGISEPQNTSQFVLNTSMDPGGYEVGCIGEQFYMVRTGGSSGSEWVSGDYLVLVLANPSSAGTMNNLHIEIKAWKIN